MGTGLVRQLASVHLRELVARGKWSLRDEARQLVAKLHVMEIRDLGVEFKARGRTARAVDGVSLEWRKGEILGIVAESGCGKSTLTRAMLGLQESTGPGLLLDSFDRADGDRRTARVGGPVRRPRSASRDGGPNCGTQSG